MRGRKPPRPLVFPGDGTALVTLTLGKVAVIDAADAPLIAEWSWHAHEVNGIWYARGSRGFMHRVILATDAPEVDHGDGDGLNNRRYNLTESDRAGNSHNTRPTKHGASGFLGVYTRDGRRYGARIMVDRKMRYLGFYATIDEARAARARAEAETWGVTPRRRQELALWVS